MKERAISNYNCFDAHCAVCSKNRGGRANETSINQVRDNDLHSVQLS